MDAKIMDEKLDKCIEEAGKDEVIRSLFYWLDESDKEEFLDAFMINWNIPDKDFEIEGEE